MYFSEKPAIQYKACRAHIPKKTTGSKGAESGYSATLYGRARGELPSGSINMKIKIDRTEGRYSLCLPLLKEETMLTARLAIQCLHCFCGVVMLMMLANLYIEVLVYRVPPS